MTKTKTKEKTLSDDEIARINAAALLMRGLDFDDPDVRRTIHFYWPHPWSEASDPWWKRSDQIDEEIR